MKGVHQIRSGKLCNGLCKHLGILLFGSLLTLHAIGQQFTATTDRDKMLIGEQLILTLQLANYDPDKITCEGWPPIPDSFQQCEVIKRGIIDTILINRLQTIRQQIVITSFDSGKHKIGPFQLVLTKQAGARKTILKANAIPLTVLMPDVSNLMDYHNVKDVIDVPEPFEWTFALSTGLVALAVTWLLWKLFTKQKKKTEPVILVPPEKALELALKRLDAMQNASLDNKETIQQYHVALDVITREYIEQASGIKALKATAFEVQQQLQVYILSQSLKDRIAYVFQINTSVKYASFIPGEKESRLVREEIIYCLKILDDAILQAHRYVG